jgi:hypothetical protein
VSSGRQYIAPAAQSATNMQLQQLQVHNPYGPPPPASGTWAVGQQQQKLAPNPYGPPSPASGTWAVGQQQQAPNPFGPPAGSASAYNPFA